MDGHEAVELIHQPDGENNKKGSQESVVKLVQSGLTVVTALLFITGEMTGSGVLALPGAVRDAGWIGIFLIIMCAGISSFTGSVLGRCWTAIRRNIPELQEHCADPYPTIGYEAFGRAGRIIVNISVYFTLYGVCVVLLLIASGNIQNLLSQVNVYMSLCYWVIIIGVLLAPFCWLKSPKDFWPIALMATLTTAIACVLIFIQALIDIPRARNETLEYLNNTPEDEQFQRGFDTFFLAFGMILFCFGGMAAFPTIQADMREPEKFPQTVVYAMAAILSLYVPVGAVGFAVYGDLVADNIFDSLSPGWLQITASILITMHLVFAYVIIQNPLSQVFEMPLNVPDEFGWKRVIVRSLITAIVIFTAESCPRFGNILALVGGSSVTLNTFVFPSVFYWKLSRKGPQYHDCRIPNWEKPIHLLIVAIGVIGGISATYAAVKQITDPHAFVPPCYVNITAASGQYHGRSAH